MSNTNPHKPRDPDRATMMANVNNCNNKTDTSDKFRMPDLIRKKRDGKEELTRQEINWFISNVVQENGVCEDAQLGKLLSSDIQIVITNSSLLMSNETWKMISYSSYSLDKTNPG